MLLSKGPVVWHTIRIGFLGHPPLSQTFHIVLIHLAPIYRLVGSQFPYFVDYLNSELGKLLQEIRILHPRSVLNFSQAHTAPNLWCKQSLLFPS